MSLWIIHKGELKVESEYVYCNKALCHKKHCEKHPDNIPKCVPVSVKALDKEGFCDKEEVVKND